MDEENVFPKGQSYSIDSDAMTRLQRPDMQFRSRYVHFHQFQSSIFTTHGAPGTGIPRNKHIMYILQKVLETSSYLAFIDVVRFLPKLR